MEKANMILRSTCIFDSVKDEPFAGYVAVKENKILAVGEGDGAEYADENTRIYELGDKTVSAGFLDNHCFPTGVIWMQQPECTDEGFEDQNPVMRKMFEDEAFITEKYLEVCDTLASRGITSTKEIGYDDFAGFPEILKKLDAEKKLKHRINVVSQPVNEPMNLEWAKKMREELHTEFLQFMGFNLMVDGGIGSHNGDMTCEYVEEPGVTCKMNVPYAEIEDMVLRADAEGFRMALHAEGDMAVKKTLDIYEKARKINGKRDSRHVITDLEMVDPADVPRMAELGVTTSNYFQIMELFPVYKELYVVPTVGEAMLDRTWAYKRMVDAGVNVVTGTDMPLDVADIPKSLYFVSGRYFLDGEPEGGFQKEQGLSVAEVLKAWTINGQYANFREDILGTLEAGKLADIAVLDDNVFTRDMKTMRDVKVQMTICDGKIVYEK